MRYRLQFRTSGLGKAKSPQLPKHRPSVGFVGGVVAGTVVAAVVISAGPAPTGKTALVVVDVSQSVEGRADVLDQHLGWLRRAGISTNIVRTTGFGLLSDGSPMNLLHTLQTAVEANPTVNSIYVFSDFDCTSPDYDYTDAPGRTQFQELMTNHRLRLYLGSFNHPPSEDLLKIANETGGGWLDTNGSPLSGSEGEMGTGILRGIVSDQSGTVVPHARVLIEKQTAISDEQGRYILFGVPAGEHSLTALSDGLWGTAESGPVKPCQAQSVDLHVGPPQEGELLVILTWNRTQRVPDDLDLHLSGEGQHVFFGTNPDDSFRPFAKLLVDNIRQPDDPATETIYISPQLKTGTFNVDVCDYRGESNDGISRSRATVQVFGGGKLLFDATAPPGGDRDWKVFTLVRESGEFKRFDQPYSDGKGLAGCLQ